MILNGQRRLIRFGSGMSTQINGIGSSMKTVDHQKFLSSISNEIRASLVKRTDWHGVTHLAVHWTLIILFGFAIYFAFPGWQLLLVPQGILIVFLFTLLHESIHQTPFKTIWLNAMAAQVSGFLIFLPPTWFKYFHLAHHRFTQIPGKDPELAFEKPTTILDYIIYVSGIPTWIGHFRTLFKNAMSNCKADFLPQKAEARIVKESRLFLFAYVMILSGNIFWMSTELFWIWLFPVLLGQPFLRFYLLAEHGLCPTVANMFENTRTTLTNRLVRFIAWNMPYHTEHHVYPMVPFHKLPELHEIIQNDLIHKEASYTVFTCRHIAELKDNN